ncbi:hypothetical protein GH733_015188 [Mirounga leonina]|nr:hypothetical protein GH733_015188 [Mirounga leonina]
MNGLNPNELASVRKVLEDRAISFLSRRPQYPALGLALSVSRTHQNRNDYFYSHEWCRDPEQRKAGASKGRDSRHHRAPEGRGLGPAPRGRGRCSRPTLGLLLLTRGGRTMPPGVEALDLPAWNGTSGRSWGPRGRSVPPRRPGRQPPCIPRSLPGDPTGPPRPLPGLLSSWGLLAPAPPRHLPPPPPASASLPPAPGAPRGPRAYTWKKCPRAQAEELSASPAVCPAPAGGDAAEVVAREAGTPGHAPLGSRRALQPCGPATPRASPCPPPGPGLRVPGGCRKGKRRERAWRGSDFGEACPGRPRCVCAERFFLLGNSNESCGKFCRRRHGPAALSVCPGLEAGERIRGFQANRQVRRLSCLLEDVRFWRNSHQADGFTVLD